MPALYAAADIFILPTQSEGMPNGLLEARAAGLPSIVTSVPGVTEVLRDSPGSYVVIESPSPKNIRVALQAMTAEVQQRSSSGCHHRRSLLPATYSLDSLAATYLALYGVLQYAADIRRAGLESYLDSTPYRWE